MVDTGHWGGGGRHRYELGVQGPAERSQGSVAEGETVEREETGETIAQFC